MAEFVTITHPDVDDTARVHPVAYATNYQHKGWRLVDAEIDDVAENSDLARHVGGGWYELPDGRRVQGLEQAHAELLADPSDDDNHEEQ